MNWDADTYEAFATLRARPFEDLLARVEHPGARHVVDAGCGTGRTTLRLGARFPHADIVGVDASPEMLAGRPTAGAPRLRFEQADLRDWRPAAPVDVVVANAVLHWLPAPEKVLRRLCSWLAPGGVLAIQVPANFDQPSHRLVHEAAAAPDVRDLLHDVEAADHVLELEPYAATMEDEGLAVDAWQTTYRMRVPAGGVLQWLTGTTLRPHVTALGPRAAPWLAELGRRLDAAYPADGRGVVFPFTRRFAVARRDR